jgi:outer membrane protein
MINKEILLTRESKMKKSFLVSTAIMVILLGYNLALGEDPNRIGMIDLQKCIEKSKEGQKLFEALKKKKDGLQKRLDSKEKELLELRKEFDKQVMMLSMDAQQSKRKTIERKTRELEYLVKDLNEEMRRAEGIERKRILNELIEIIQKIGDEGKYAMILEKRVGGVLYWAKPFDLTDEVTKAYDQMKGGK